MWHGYALIVISAFLKDFVVPQFSPPNHPTRAKEENAFIFSWIL